MSDYLSGKGTQLLEKSLDALWYRQRVISNNIANKQTENYKSKSVEFESELRRLLDAGDFSEGAMDKALNRLQPKLLENTDTTDSENGNNVNVDKENIELAKVQIQYGAMITAINSQINRMKYAINGGQ